MGRLRNRGERTDVIFNEVDLMILKIITQSSKEIAVMQLNDMLDLTHSSLKKHLDWLVNIKLVNRIPIEGTRKIILKPTAEGRMIYKILTKNIPRDTYKNKY